MAELSAMKKNDSLSPKTRHCL